MGIELFLLLFVLLVGSLGLKIQSILIGRFLLKCVVQIMFIHNLKKHVENIALFDIFLYPPPHKLIDKKYIYNKQLLLQSIKSCM